MKILAIETSCDETAAAIVEENDFRPVVITNVVSSQIAIHANSGGVIPNLAARLHTENLPAVLQAATKNPSTLLGASKTLDYDAIAVTAGPGLVGCLLIGVAAAKTLAMATDKPFFAINHLEGHIYSAWLNSGSGAEQPAGINPVTSQKSSANDWSEAVSERGFVAKSHTVPELPALIVIVSGGHTELVLMEKHLQYRHLGRTRDDAAGEAFDKVARLLGLGYPGGPLVSELARHGNPKAFDLPIGLPEKTNLEFSFSGLKAAVAHLIKTLPDPLPEHTKADIAASFEQTVSDTICRKALAALSQHPNVKSVCLVGGVAANHRLRVDLETAVHSHTKAQFFVAPKEYCTDNAAMIGAAAIFHHLFGKPGDWREAEVDPNRSL